MNTKLLDQVADTGSKLEKQKLLKGCDASTKRFLVWALDPAITFGVTVDQTAVEKGWKKDRDSAWWDAVDKLCKKLSRRELTGNAAETAVTNLLTNSPSKDDTVWACRVLNKDLRAGFSESTLNKVFPGIIEPFAVALAKPYEPDKHELAGSWIIEPKLDGLRMCIVDGVPFTRNGRVINTVGHILEQLGPKVLKDFVVDGECMGEKDFDSASGDIRRKSTGTNTSLVYNAFDLIRREEWESRKTAPFSRRRKELEEYVVGDKNVRVTTAIPLDNPTTEVLFRTRDYFMGQGFEGAMLKRADAPYCFKRSDNLLKLKDFTDSDGTVTGFVEGKGKYKGMLGAIWADFDGVATKVGSGYDDDQRQRLWEIRETLVGEVIETQHQGKAVDGALRFPVFIRFRQDKS